MRHPTAALTFAASLAAACAGNPKPMPGSTLAEDAPRQSGKQGWRAALRDHYPGPDKPWERMTHEERKAYMRDVVVPAMEELFLAYDAEAHAGFGCRTCHGKGARKRDYAMPAPHLFTLYPSGSPEQKRTVQDKEEAARFMFNAVTPTVRALLGQPRYDKDTGEGFSCFRCHPQGDSEMVTIPGAAL